MTMIDGGVPVLRECAQEGEGQTKMVESQRMLRPLTVMVDRSVVVAPAMMMMLDSAA